MREFIAEWVVILITSTVTLTLFESLLPDEEIKKSCMFVGRLIFMIAVLVPLVSLINKGFDMDLWQSFYDYTMEMDKGIVENSALEDDVQRQLLENLYYENTVNLIENYVNHIPGVAHCKADVILDKSQEGSSYGIIRKITVTVRYDETKNQRPKADQIQVKISEYFEVEKEYVYVSIT